MGDVSNGNPPSSLKIRKITKGFKINKKLRYNPSPNTQNLKRRADTVPKMGTSVIESRAKHEWIDRSDREATDLLRQNLDLRAEVEKLKNLLKQSTHKSVAKAGNAIPNGSAVATRNRFEALSDRMDDNAPSASSALKDFLTKLKETNNSPAKQTTTPRDAIKSKDSSPTCRSNNPSQQSNKSNQSPVAGHKRVSKPPPIIIEGQDSSNTVKLCAEHLKITDFHTKNLSSGKHITYIHNPADYEVVKEALKTVDTTFFTYTKKENTNRTCSKVST